MPVPAEPQPNPSRPTTNHRGTSGLVLSLLAGLITVLFVVVFSQTAFNLTFLRPDSNEQIQVFAALSSLIFLLFVLLSFVLARTVLKLLSERRMGVLGSKFRTRMVAGALLLSLGPVIFLFVFTYGLMNRSIDKWFSRPVEEVSADTAAMTSLMGNYATQNARAEAETLAGDPTTQRAFLSDNFAGVLAQFREHERTLQGGFAVALRGDEVETSFHLPKPWAETKEQIAHASHGTGGALVVIWDKSQYVVADTPVGSNGRILVAMPLPAQFTETVRRAEASQQQYLALSKERKLFRRTYIGMLSLLTIAVLFAATWFALFLSKQVTRPVEALAQATQEISAGRLDYRITVMPPDEFGDLVRRFNQMAADLEFSRLQLTASTHELGEANQELEKRRQQMETILESIPTGVLSIDASRRVMHANTALQRMFDSHGRATMHTIAGARLEDLFSEDMLRDIDSLLRRADRMGTTTSQLDLPSGGASVHAAVTVASLLHGSQRLGWVVVFEDLSDLMHAQRQAAWREVARRVAHEIKNPLTPIALSAERIRRHLSRSDAPSVISIAVMQSCAETISSSVETVRTLVDEFSALARFPNAQPQPADINSIVESTLAMFEGRLDGIQVHTALAPGLPPVLADTGALTRALANLVDNAAEAMERSMVREIQVSTAWLEGREAIEVVIADTGHGVTQELKEKLFLPYFSTKQRGTGLGLAIVSRTIEDHRGSIRVEKNHPVGTRFILELPLAPDPSSTPTPLVSGTGSAITEGDTHG